MKSASAATDAAPAMADGLSPADAPPDLFGLTTVRLGETIYDAVWREAANSDLPRGDVGFDRAVARLAAMPLRERVAAANAWVNARIAYAPNVELSKHWGTLAKGLARGAGEREDIAIAKLQLLAAAGTPRRDLYLVLTRDWAREADDALLVVRNGDAGEAYVLDSRADAVLPADRTDRYFPVLALNAEGAWVFGKRATPGRGTGMGLYVQSAAFVAEGR
jgi:predicted transglutaminase-like cysteine proteinase